MNLKRGRQDHAGSLTATGAWDIYLHIYTHGFVCVVCVSFLFHVGDEREKKGINSLEELEGVICE